MEIQCKLLNVTTCNIINWIMSSIWKSPRHCKYLSNLGMHLFGHCYHLVDLISLTLLQSDYIKWLPLHLMFFHVHLGEQEFFGVMSVSDYQC